MDEWFERPISDPAFAYSATTACKVAGITYRQLDYWARTGVVIPSKIAYGQGSRRYYAFNDILRLRIVARLIDTGIDFPHIQTVVDYVSTKEAGFLQGLTILSDGLTIFESVNDKEVIKLTKHFQSFFGIAIGSVMNEVEKNLLLIKEERIELEKVRTRGSSSVDS